MYYKVIKDNKVIDVLDKLIYLKWQPKHKTMILSDINEAQAILSSGQDAVWHEKTLYNIPVEAGHYDVVEIQEINQYEYNQLKMLNGKTPEEIADELILDLINNHII